MNKVPKLVAVSKKQEDYKIDKAIECGQKFFGENRVQEASKKFKTYKKSFNDLELHLRGPFKPTKLKMH